MTTRVRPLVPMVTCANCKRLREENEALKGVISGAYNQFAHLDHLLSNAEWMLGGTPFHKTCFDLWQAVKRAREIGALDGE